MIPEADFKSAVSTRSTTRPNGHCLHFPRPHVASMSHSGKLEPLRSFCLVTPTDFEVDRNASLGSTQVLTPPPPPLCYPPTTPSMPPGRLPKSPPGPTRRTPPP